MSAVELNAVVEGEIVKIKPFGAIVLLPDRTQGLVHISHISNRFVQNIEDFLGVGDKVLVKVIGVDKEGGRISLSIKEAAAATAEPRFETRHAPTSLDEKLKEWQKASNERQAGLNKRNKRR